MANLVDFSSLNEMLYGDDRYIKEFAEAAVVSFNEFKESFKNLLIAKDEENLRKAGHKIKPVAQMLGLQQIIDEYEHAKALLWDENPDEGIQASIKKMNDICEQVCAELNGIIQ